MIPYKRVPNLANKLLTKKQTNKPPDISHSATRKHQCTQQIAKSLPASVKTPSDNLIRIFYNLIIV